MQFYIFESFPYPVMSTTAITLVKNSVSEPTTVPYKVAQAHTSIQVNNLYRTPSVASLILWPK